MPFRNKHEIITNWNAYGVYAKGTYDYVANNTKVLVNYMRFDV